MCIKRTRIYETFITEKEEEDLLYGITDYKSNIFQSKSEHFVI